MSESGKIGEEKRRARELDSLCDAAKKAIFPHLTDVLTSFLDGIKDSEKEADGTDAAASSALFPEQTAAAMEKTSADYVHAVERLVVSSFMLGMVHADDDRPGKKINAADGDGVEPDEIPPIPFSEAQKFLESKVPLTKSEWEKLEPKVRFRAFTVARLGQAELIERAKHELARSVAEGTGYAETWRNMRDLAGNGGGLSPWYWETVFRTNTQSAYVAGKLQQYEGSGAKAYQLMVIDDSRTTDICRKLLRESGYGMTLKIDHPFWKKYGFPPYHFNCRTSVRAVWNSQFVDKGGEEVLDSPSLTSLKKFRPAEGFGGNPLDNGNWWMMTPSQIEQAIKYGLLSETSRMENVFADYHSVWKNYTRHEGKDGGWYDLWKKPPEDWKQNKPVVEFLADRGYKIKVLPTIENIKGKYNQNWSNPDIILDGILTDIKQVETSITSRLKKIKEQRLRSAVLVIPKEFTIEEINKAFDEWSHGTIKVTWIYKGRIYTRDLK